MKAARVQEEQAQREKEAGSHLYRYITYAYSYHI